MRLIIFVAFSSMKPQTYTRNDVYWHLKGLLLISGDVLCQILYSSCDTGNYFVIPGSPAEAWEVDHFMGSHQDSLRDKMNFGSDDFVIAIVGSQLLYGGMWLEHALVLQAMLPLFRGFPPYNDSTSNVKVVVLSGDSTHNYSVAVEVNWCLMIVDILVPTF